MVVASTRMIIDGKWGCIIFFCKQNAVLYWLVGEAVVGASN